MSVFYRFKINANLFMPFSLLSEIDILKEWIPGFLKADVIKNHSNFRRALHMVRDMPFPLSNREFISCSSQMIVKERKGVMVILRSINEEREQYWDIKAPQEDPDIVRG